MQFSAILTEQVQIEWPGEYQTVGDTECDFSFLLNPYIPLRLQSLYVCPRPGSPAYRPLGGATRGFVYMHATTYLGGVVLVSTKSQHMFNFWKI